MFPDQFGRLTGLKLNAEYFLEVVESSKKKKQDPVFELNYNPFRYDILGKPITVPETLNMTKSLRLSPDLDTLREQPWLSK